MAPWTHTGPVHLPDSRQVIHLQQLLHTQQTHPEQIKQLPRNQHRLTRGNVAETHAFEWHLRHLITYLKQNLQLSVLLIIISLSASGKIYIPKNSLATELVERNYM